MDAKPPPSRPTLAIGSAKSALPKASTVLLLVDFINPLNFPEANELAPAALQAARAAAALKRQLAKRGVQSIYANDNDGVWRSEFSDVLAYCCSLRNEAGEMARLLAPAPRDLTILKPRHSGFYATPLELLLTQMHARRLVIVGIAADICVQMTAMDATMRGYRVWVPADCTAAESPERASESLAFMRDVLGCDVRPARGRL